MKVNVKPDGISHEAKLILEPAIERAGVQGNFLHEMGFHDWANLFYNLRDQLKASLAEITEGVTLSLMSLDEADASSVPV